MKYHVLGLAASALAQDWDSAYSKATQSLARLNLTEKVGIVTGIGWQKGPCVGNTSPAPSIGFPSLCLQDGPLGTRFAANVTAFTPAIQAASTWDIALIRQRAEFLAREARLLGVHVSLGPVAGPLGKIPRAGRNWEGFGSDPYLSGIAVGETVAAMQGQGVQATVKHWLLNEQEAERETITSDPDERTLRELYAWPFADALHADAVAVMCSYNRINGTWACENEHTLNQILKHEMGFRGYVMSDWNAQHSTVESANSGLDMTMPGDDLNGGHIYWGPHLENAVQTGEIHESRLDDMVLRVLAGWYLVNQDNGGYPSIDLSRDVRSVEHADNVRAVARDGIVLLKNEGGILPLRKISTMAVVGSAAVLGSHARNGCPDRGCADGAIGMGWGSGSVNYPYFVAPYDAIRDRAELEGTHISLSGSDNPDAAAQAAKGKDVVIVVITADSGEGYITVEGNAGDRVDLDPWHHGNELVRAAASAGSDVVVVVHSVGPVILEDVLSHDAVKAVVWAGMPSSESGNALMDVLYDVSPSGKLVYTIAKRAEDYGVDIRSGRDGFEEGLFVDYKRFEAANIEPRFEFGFGLSYTSFTYSGLELFSAAGPGPANQPVVPGGPADLFDIVATVSVEIQNTGPVTGAEVAQLYLSLPPDTAPGTPARQLRGFFKVSLQPSEHRKARFQLRRRDLSFWDQEREAWIVPTGEFRVCVGSSSKDIRVSGKFVVE